MINKFNLSQILLSLAVAFLAFSLIKIANQIPDILRVVEKSGPKVDAIVDEANLIRKEVRLVRLLVAQQTPEILAKVENTLPVVKQVITESGRYSSQLPAAFEQVEKLTQDIQQLRESLPSILQRIDAIVDATNNTTSEVAKWRPHSRGFLSEIALSRENIPQYLLRAENIVIDAKSIGKEASSGIVSGFFKGVISLPFEVVSGLAGIVDSNSRSAKYLTAADVSLMQEKVVSLLNDKNQSKAVWQNIESDNRGTINKGKLIKRNQQNCHRLTFNNYFSKERETLKELMCINNDGLWRVM